MRRARLAAVALWSLLAVSGCTGAGTPSICDVPDGAVVIFPSGGGDVPRNAVVRVLSGGRADDSSVRLLDPGDVEVPGLETLFATTYGDVLELAPSVLLDADTRYRVEVLDGFGRVVATDAFTTGIDVEDGPAGVVAGDVAVTPIDGRDRVCCSGSGCVDGSVLTLPGLAGDSYRGQLLLVAVDALGNDACGPTRDPVGVVPVVWDGEDVISAETDLFLDGCYEVAVVTETLRDAVFSPVCAPGLGYEPLPATAECRATGGCECGAGGAGGGDGVALALGLAGLLAWRRRARRVVA